jgi:hypothetical protein
MEGETQHNQDLVLPCPTVAWAHPGRIFDDQFVGQSGGPKPQDVSRDELHGHVLNVTLVDKCAIAGVEVLEDKAALGLIELDERVVVVDVCRLKQTRTVVAVNNNDTTP